ncbi:NAD-dependent epimerase/dehydratase family protein [Microbacterium sp. CPCC 204701]|uniref:NAD-dependent epimerase/dehydratase family protein n=1 Tax=Microbacterium sp. CPCC 204701 TaxID=2493084 RepID=UPI000FD978C6|nr:NAD-dependent epimerase/dehydratase family protein [Microbacterium sp. CPCC 204701]
MSEVLLVTGGAGFIGSRIVAQASAAGWRVRVLDSLRTDVHPAGAKPGGGVEFVHADMTDAAAVARAVHGVDVVCHQAAKVGLGVDLDDAADYVRSNDLGTAVLLSAMARAGVVRLVLASSMVVYGEGRYRDELGEIAAPPRAAADLAAGRFDPLSPRTGAPLVPELIDENAPLDPRNVYAASKVAQEHLVRAWARETGGRGALLRYHNVYGPGMPQATPYAGVASIFRSALEAGQAPAVLEDGRQRRDFVHVTDVAAANLAALEWTATAPAGSARAFNVASGEVRTIGELADALADAIGGPRPVITGGYRLGDVRHVTASAQRLRDELGWRPQVGFRDGVREFAHAALRPRAGS